MLLSDNNLTVKYPLFQAEFGGSTPTLSLQISDYQLFRCKWQDLVPILKEFHYRKDMVGGSIKVCLGVYCNGILVGGVVFGNLWHPAKYAENGKYKPIELRRLCFLDEAPKNSESWAIAKGIWWLKKYTQYNRIISYSDAGANHKGTIYKAAGFTLIGETGGGQKIHYKGREFHVRSLSIERDYAKDLAKAVKSGDAQIVDTGVKRIWVKDFINKRGPRL